MSVDVWTAERFAEITRSLVAATPGQARQQITDAALTIVAGCVHASISLIDRHGGIMTVAATDPVAARIGELWTADGTGPGAEAIRTGTVCSWPEPAAVAAETGVSSTLAIPLAAGGGVFGALVLHRSGADAFDSNAIALASVLAVHAASALAGARTREHCAELEEALRSCRQIAMAVGIVMANRRVTPDEAFEVLRRISSRQGRKVREVAAEVTETGQVPEAVRTVR